MSLATNQTLALLIMSWGALKLIDLEGHSADDIAGTLQYALDVNEDLIEHYPATGSMDKTKAWIKQKNLEWKNQGDDMTRWHPVVLATMSSNIACDLLDRIRNRAVVEKLEALRDAATAISLHFADRAKDEYRHFKEAEAMVEQYHKIIGFEP